MQLKENVLHNFLQKRKQRTQQLKIKNELDKHLHQSKKHNTRQAIKNISKPTKKNALEEMLARIKSIHKK